MYIFPKFFEICLKFKFLCSKTDFLKKNIQNFRTLKKDMSITNYTDTTITKMTSLEKI